MSIDVNSLTSEGQRTVTKLSRCPKHPMTFKANQYSPISSKQLQDSST